MTPDLELQRRLVAKLSDKLLIHEGCFLWRADTVPNTIDDELCIPVGEREWDCIVRMVEATIPETKRGYYNAALSLIASERNLSAAVKEPEFIFLNQTASWQQRATALAKIGVI